MQMTCMNEVIDPGATLMIRLLNDAIREDINGDCQ